MEWRCKWCGKPHEENDPPCDNCGHGQFEQAVVAQTDLSEGKQEATLVWVCTQCGREHPKHSPPCSRCGNSTLDKQRQELDKSELATPGYLELLTPRYAVAIVVTVLLGGVLLLGFVGVIDLPGLGGPTVPDVENVPGNESTVEGVPLSDVEEAYVRVINDHRRDDGLGALERNAFLDDVARSSNQQNVKRVYADGDPVNFDEVNDLLAEECRGDVSYQVVTVVYDGQDATALGDQLATAALNEGEWAASQSIELVGIDAHSVEGRVVVAQYTCR